MIKNIVLMLLLMTSSLAYANDGFILESIKDAQSLSEKTKQPILLIFGADYCEHCVRLKQDIILGNLSSSMDKYIICYINISKNSDLSKEYNISSIPDSRIIRSNKETSFFKGYAKNKYLLWLKNDK